METSQSTLIFCLGQCLGRLFRNASCPSRSRIAKIVLQEAPCSLPMWCRGGCCSLGGRREREEAAETTAFPQGRPQRFGSATDSPWGQKITGSPRAWAWRRLQPAWCDVPRATTRRHCGDIPGSRSMAGAGASSLHPRWCGCSWSILGSGSELPPSQPCPSLGGSSTNLCPQAPASLEHQEVQSRLATQLPGEHKGQLRSSSPFFQNYCKT